MDLKSNFNKESVQFYRQEYDYEYIEDVISSFSETQLVEFYNKLKQQQSFYFVELIGLIFFFIACLVFKMNSILGVFAFILAIPIPIKLQKNIHCINIIHSIQNRFISKNIALKTLYNFVIGESFKFLIIPMLLIFISLILYSMSLNYSFIPKLNLAWILPSKNSLVWLLTIFPVLIAYSSPHIIKIHVIDTGIPPKRSILEKSMIGLVSSGDSLKINLLKNILKFLVFGLTGYALIVGCFTIETHLPLNKNFLINLNFSILAICVIEFFCFIQFKQLFQGIVFIRQESRIISRYREIENFAPKLISDLQNKLDGESISTGYARFKYDDLWVMRFQILEFLKDTGLTAPMKTGCSLDHISIIDRGNSKFILIDMFVHKMGSNFETLLDIKNDIEIAIIFKATNDLRENNKNAFTAKIAINLLISFARKEYITSSVLDEAMKIANEFGFS